MRRLSLALTLALTPPALQAQQSPPLEIGAVAPDFSLPGATRYGVLAKPWVAAQGKTIEQFKARQAKLRGSPRAYAPFIIAFVAEFVMAWILAGVLGHLGPGQVTVRNGIISALFLWAGFVATTMAVKTVTTAGTPRSDGGVGVAHALQPRTCPGRTAARRPSA